jgi:hypothetical protein
MDHMNKHSQFHVWEHWILCTIQRATRGCQIGAQNRLVWYMDHIHLYCTISMDGIGTTYCEQCKERKGSEIHACIRALLGWPSSSGDLCLLGGRLPSLLLTAGEWVMGERKLLPQTITSFTCNLGSLYTWRLLAGRRGEGGNSGPHAWPLTK